MISTFLASALFMSISIADTTWNDNDDGNIISFDGDQGWKILECEDTSNYCDSMVPFCGEDSDCRREDNSGKKYYGPFNNDDKDSKWMLRRFQCEVSSDVSIQLQVSSCNAYGAKNLDDLTIWIVSSDGSTSTKLGKYSIESVDGVLLDDDGILSQNGCDSFMTQDINTGSFPVHSSERFEVRFRHRNQDNAKAYLHDIQVTCSPSKDPKVVSEDDDGQVYTHEEYCVSGFTGDMEHYNGEYPLFSTMDQPVVDPNGYFYFQKHDLYGGAYMYLTKSIQGRKWVIGQTLDGDDYDFECNEDADLAGHYFMKLNKLDWGSITVEEHECEHHYLISNVAVLWNLPALIALVAVLVNTCIVCWFLCKKKKPYGKMLMVVEDESDDTADEDEELL